jgi:hypothetical protein
VSAPDDTTAIVVGSDARRVGELVADLESRGVRAAAFLGDPAVDGDALREMLAELFGRRDGRGAPSARRDDE